MILLIKVEKRQPEQKSAQEHSTVNVGSIYFEA